MLLGTGYDIVARNCLKPVTISKGTNTQEMMGLLRSISGRDWLLESLDFEQTVYDQRSSGGRRILLIQGDSRHWIAVNGRVVHDPEFTQPFFCDIYPRRHWRILVVIGKRNEREFWLS
jgi:hypothetical protein